MSSYLTAKELDSIQHMHKRAPYAIDSISQTIFSIARHYGAMRFRDCAYTYLPETDECIRDDVLRAVEKMRRKAKPASKETEQKPFGF